MHLIKDMKIKYLFILLIFVISCESSSDLALNSGQGNFESGTGIGGSMARFTILDDYLYTVDSRSLITFDIKDQVNPLKKTEVSLGWGIETIFPYNNKLFIGAQSGMHIYGLEDKEEPNYISTYQHVTSCDL